MPRITILLHSLTWGLDGFVVFPREDPRSVPRGRSCSLNLQLTWDPAVRHSKPAPNKHKLCVKPAILQVPVILVASSARAGVFEGKAAKAKCNKPQKRNNTVDEKKKVLDGREEMKSNNMQKTDRAKECWGSNEQLVSGRSGFEDGGQHSAGSDDPKQHVKPQIAAITAMIYWPGAGGVTGIRVGCLITEAYLWRAPSESPSQRQTEHRNASRDNSLSAVFALITDLFTVSQVVERGTVASSSHQTPNGVCGQLGIAKELTPHPSRAARLKRNRNALFGRCFPCFEHATYTLLDCDWEPMSYHHFSHFSLSLWK
ncbi:uncharacterized protein BDR25DRAFT_350576 [Lindgomyces ingoldianus]|uniref:Uncharacterized protein n=1 Tax=Lindgomyces ingoldianus TaxID=673940 RepID=A0ACB6R9G7_9PLEO|nr:uncharacterized protein BDR25DRAFT_350576 [Lindgomyces ingoldianus]KAF2475167.1 hypothetical protein BDR25DRAFT_350576 [Lindgomyces ingoldianus]